MPPLPVPTQTRAAASATTERSLPSAIAIGFSPTTTISGAPYEIDRMQIASSAATQDARLSTLSGKRPARVAAPR